MPEHKKDVIPWRFEGRAYPTYAEALAAKRTYYTQRGVPLPEDALSGKDGYPNVCTACGYALDQHERWHGLCARCLEALKPHPHTCPDCSEDWACADADCDPEAAEGLKLCTHCRQAYLR
jgi:hypothetical protein